MRCTTKVTLLACLLAAGCIIPDPIYPEDQAYSSVAYGTPGYGTPGYGAPGYGAPGYGGAVYSAPGQVFYADGYYWSQQPDGWYWWSHDSWARSIYTPYALRHHQPAHIPGTYGVRSHVPSHTSTHGVTHGLSGPHQGSSHLGGSHQGGSHQGGSHHGGRH